MATPPELAEACDFRGLVLQTSQTGGFDRKRQFFELQTIPRDQPPCRSARRPFAFALLAAPTSTRSFWYTTGHASASEAQMLELAALAPIDPKTGQCAPATPAGELPVLDCRIAGSGDERSR